MAQCTRARAVPVAVAACVGVSWALYRQVRKIRKQKVCNSSLPVGQQERAQHEPLERLHAHVDATLRLRSLSHVPLGIERGNVEIAYAAKVPTDVVCTSTQSTARIRSIAGAVATAAFVIAFVCCTFALLDPILHLRGLPTTVLMLIVLILSAVALQLLGGGGGSTYTSALPSHWSVRRLRAFTRSRPKAAAVRAIHEVQPDQIALAWRSAAMWAAAPATGSGQVRTWARRDSGTVVLVEATPGTTVIAPLKAFVLEARGTEGYGGLTVHCYVVPSSPKDVKSIAATATADLHDLLGAASKCDALAPLTNDSHCSPFPSTTDEIALAGITSGFPKHTGRNKWLLEQMLRKFVISRKANINAVKCYEQMFGNSTPGVAAALAFAMSPQGTQFATQILAL